ncbi:MAG: hypothetical protein U0900_04790 [Myxococcota bacterium]
MIEISQVCAVQTGCFADDTPGFPVTIAAAGSYRLTSNLVVPNDDTDGIRISTSDVAIDLNRFTLTRTSCLDNNSNCRPNSGAGNGIETTATSVRGISVFDGSVTGMGTSAIVLGEQAEVRDVLVRWNGGDAIVVGLGSTVEQALVFQNGGDGIVADAGSRISDSTIYDNVSDGIQTGAGCSIQRNTVRTNGGVGLRLGSQSFYRENTLTSNGGGCVAGGVSASDNGCNGGVN